MNRGTRSIFAKKLGVLLALSCLSALPAVAGGLGQSTSTKQFQKTLTLGANQTVSLTNKFGDVHIHGDKGQDVKISATIRVQAHSQADADRYADQVRIDVSQDSSGIKIQTIYPSDESKFLRSADRGARRIRSITISPCRWMPSCG